MLRSVLRFGPSLLVLHLSMTLGAAAECGPWQWQSPLPQGNDLHDVVATADGFLAVGDGGTMLVSPDGLDWAPVDSGTDQDLYGVAVGDGIILALGERGAILLSEDGSSWSASTPVTDRSLRAVARGPQGWVAVGDGGTVLSSPDGFDWELQPQLTPASLQDVIWDGELFIAVGHYRDPFEIGVILSSADGLQWEVQIPQDQATQFSYFLLYEVVRVEDRVFIAGYQFVDVGLGSACTQLLISSTDLATWTVHSWPIDPPFEWPTCSDGCESWRGIAAAGGRLVTVGEAGSAAAGPAGSDGACVDPATERSLHAVAYREGRWLAVGETGVIVVSDDAESWAAVGGQRDLDLYGIASSGREVVGVTSRGHVMTADALSGVERIFTVTASDLFDVTWTGEAYVAVGELGAVRASRDGLNWEHRPPAVAADLRAVATNPAGAVLAVGDGFAVSLGSQGDRRGRPVPVDAELNGLAWSSMGWIAVGEDDAVLVSADGYRWEAESTPPLRTDLHDVAVGCDAVVAVGSGGRVLLRSADGGWSLVPSGTLADLHAVEWTGERFLAVGEGGVALSSFDGTAWFAEQTPARIRLRAAVWTGSELWVAGDGGAMLSTSCPEQPSIEWPGRRVVVVPAVARLDGLGGTRWRSELVLHNPGSVEVVAGLYLMERGRDNSGARPAIVTVAAGGLLRINDALSLFPDAAAEAGALLVSSDTELIVTSRTFNDAATGSYGQFVPGIPFAELLRDGPGSSSTGTVLQISSTQEKRSNIGVVNASAQPLEVMIEFFAPDGVWIRDLVGQLPPFGMRQWNEVLSALSAVDGAWARISSPTPGAAFAAWASVVDNASGDPVLVLPDVPRGGGAGRGQVPTPDPEPSGPEGCGPWRQLVSPTAGEALRGIASAGGRRIAVGGRGSILMSENGGAWQLVSRDLFPDLQAIHRVGEQFVAVGEDGVVLISDNGSSWRRLPTLSYHHLRDVAAIGDRLVAVGDGGTMLVGGDDRPWRETTPAIGDDLVAIAAGAGQLIAVGKEGTFLSSPDGLEWTIEDRSDVAYGEVADIAWTGERWLVVQRWSKILVSENGRDWEPVDSPVTGARSAAVGEPGVVVAVDHGNIYTSPDGLTWSHELLDEVFGNQTRPDLLAVSWTGDRFTVVGRHATVLVAPDLEQWSLETLDHVDLEGVVWDGTRFVAVGTESVLVSAGGGSWERLATLDGYYVKDVAFNGELYVAVGWHGLLLTSPDGIDWTRIEVDPDERTELTRVRWLGERFVVLGRRNLSGFPGVMLSSDDGVDWSELREFPDNALRDIAFDGARWFVAANQAAYISDDFEEWTEVELPGQLSVITATHGAGLFVAAGWPFAILTSPDGENWQIRTISNRTVADLHDVVWTGARFVVVGNSLFDSSDGLDWQEVEPDHWVALDAVAWGMDRLVAVGAEAQRGAAVFSSRCEAGLVPPVADFGWSPDHYTPGEPVFFTDDSTGEIDRRQWDFGDGWYSFTSDPAHVFEEPWAQQVSLWIEGPGGSDEHGDFLTSTVPPPPPPSKVVPAAAHTDGLEGTRWRTDLYVVNPGIFFDAEYELVFLPQGEDNSAAEGIVLRLGPRKAVRYGDVVAEVLGATGAGALRLDPVAGPLPAASTRTFNSTAGGSYGQGIPARLSIEALGSGDEGRLSHLRRTADFRTNIGFVNLSGLPIEVVLDLYAVDGGSLGTLVVELEPWSFDQLTDVLAELGTIEGAYAVVSTETPDGRFLAYASVVDNSSGDPIYVPVVRWP